MRTLFVSLLVFISWPAASWAEPVASEAGSPDEAEPLEGAPILFARDLLEPTLLSGARFRVQPIVEVENFSYVFRIDSDYGRFEVLGVDNVRLKVGEIHAIERLNQISQTEAFAKTLANRLRDPVVVTVGIARRPLSTVAGLPTGIGRYLQGKLYQVKRGSEKAWSTLNRAENEKEKEAFAAEPEADGEDGGDLSTRKVIDTTGKLSRKYLGYDDAKRGWSKRLGVDPYSDNPALQQALGRISWATSLGNFAGDYAVPSTEAFSYAGKAQEVVWDRSPLHVERLNAKGLRRVGVSKELIKRFTDSDGYSLTEKTALSLSMQEMKEAEGADAALELALRAATLEEAQGFVKTFAILEAYDRKVSPVTALSIRDGLIVGEAQNGFLILPLAVDYLHWTPLISTPLLAPALAAERRELWVAGNVSAVAADRLRHCGWHVFEDCLDPDRQPTTNAYRLAPSRPQPQASPSSERAANL